MFLMFGAFIAWHYVMYESLSSLRFIPFCSKIEENSIVIHLERLRITCLCEIENQSQQKSYSRCTDDDDKTNWNA